MKRVIQFVCFCAMTAFMLLNVAACHKTEDERDRFIGNFKVLGQYADGTETKSTVVVVPSSNPREVLMSYAPSGAAIKATVSGNELLINTDQMYISNGLNITLTGFGRMYNDNLITLNAYYSASGRETLRCSETWTKK
jgi:hypothetical protein